MKTKIYNNLIFSLLFVCSIFFGLFGGVGVFAQSAIDPAVLEHARSVITYTATHSEVRTARDGGKYVEVVFSDISDDGWDDNIKPRLLRSTTGRGNVPISFRVTEGDVFFSDGGKSKTVSWRPGTSIPLDVYFEGDTLPGFSLAPIIKGFELNAVSPGFRSEESFDEPSGEQQPTTLNPKTGSVTKPKPQTLHLYSTIFGEEKQIVTSPGDREAVSRTVQGIFGRIFSVIFTVAGIIMVLMLAVHGTRMIYSEFNGNVSVFSDAKKQVIDIAKGAAILMLSWVILSFVDPNLLRPRLFQTITQLSEVGSGAHLYSNHIEIPDAKKSVQFTEGKNTLSITRCPQIVDDRFSKSSGR